MGAAWDCIIASLTPSTRFSQASNSHAVRSSSISPTHMMRAVSARFQEREDFLGVAAAMNPCSLEVSQSVTVDIRNPTELGSATEDPVCRQFHHRFTPTPSIRPFSHRLNNLFALRTIENAILSSHYVG
eukprot:scaffold2315_cov113-Cylindrotheca_fusiformis.AAC.20